jgi:hypothetical protein
MPNGSSFNVMHSMMEEELINVFFLIFLIPSGYIIKMGIHSCLSIWAVMHVSELFKSILDKNPNIIGLSALKPLNDYILVSKVELALLKNSIEMTLGLICIPMVFFNQAAIIFPIIYFQYIRIKYVSSFFMKEAFKVLNQ